MANETKKVLGVDIGGTKIAICIADTNGEIVASDRVPSGATTPYEQVIPQIIDVAKKVVAKAGLQLSDIIGCGICAPGPLDMKGGRIMKSPNLAWDAVPIRDDLVKGLNMPVYMDNDANAGVLAEWFFGSAKGKKDVIYLTMSTGVGGGIVSGGKLVTGATGIAGELGHIILDINGPMCGCGQCGCLEAYCGGRSVALRLQDRLRYRPDNAILAVAAPMKHDAMLYKVEEAFKGLEDSKDPKDPKDPKDFKEASARDAEVDRLLDKIKREGYSSLTQEEKDRLFKH